MVSRRSLERKSLERSTANAEQRSRRLTYRGRITNFHLPVVLVLRVWVATSDEAKSRLAGVVGVLGHGGIDLFLKTMGSPKVQDPLLSVAHSEIRGIAAFQRVEDNAFLYLQQKQALFGNYFFRR